ncbi:MAG: tRNA pseudouridine(55) synthase TruB [Candidatus Cryptobacteroides sp.]
MGAFVPDKFTESLSHDIGDYPEGIIIPVDKPYRWTSADVIRKIKFAAFRHFGSKKLKVGHAGTLDPLAVGVLLVCIGKATKLAETLQNHDKEYVAGITFGATTPSYDREKDIDRFFPCDNVCRENIVKVLDGFIGEQEQIAPLFSAKSLDGVRAYELARKLQREGKALDEAASELIRSSRITISEAELIHFQEGNGMEPESLQAIMQNACEISEDVEKTETETADTHAVKNASSRIRTTDNSYLGLPEAKIRIVCTKGTYVRAFARDLGEALGTGAHLSSLVRTRSGDFRIDDALSVEKVIELLVPVNR